MTKLSKQRHLLERLNTVESQFTPGQWAVKLIDEMRQYPTEQEFLKATLKRPYRESAFLRPYYALSQKAQDRYPGPQELSARNKLNRDLRMEFQFLKTLVVNVNEAITAKVEMFMLIEFVTFVQLRYVDGLMADDVFLRSALVAADGIRRLKSNSGDQKSNRELQGLASYATVIAQQGPASVVDIWARTDALLLKQLYAYRIAVHAVQDKFFDSHPILSHDREDALNRKIEILVGATIMLTKYLEERSHVVACALEPENQSQEPKGQRDPIDVEAIEKAAREEGVDEIVNAWVTTAREQGVAHILQETGENLDFIWENFQKKFGTNN